MPVVKGDKPTHFGTLNMSINDLKNRAKGISVELFAADLGNLRRAAQNVAEWDCKTLHFGVVDGVFAPEMVGGPGFVAAMDVGLLRDVRLMVQNPVDHVAGYLEAGADMITIQAESADAAEAIKIIQGSGKAVLAGLAVMPGTSLQDAAPLLALNPDVILLPTMDLRDKQRDIAATCARLTELRAQLPDCLLAIEGGVNRENIAEICASGPDIVICGRAILEANKPKRAYIALVKALETKEL